jgi:ATP-dependent DNA helicase RecQ
VARDIAARLGLRDPVMVSTGFDRPNLSFVVAPCRTTADKHARIAKVLSEPDALPAIVYAGTRKRCDQLADTLGKQLGTEVVSYHAGLQRDKRAAAQDRFMDGRVQVVVATNAFGMGVDKADVRTVIHETVPPSLEAYYQEAGRAGRDGAPAKALLFAEPRDKGLHVYFIERAEVTDESLDRVARQLVNEGGRNGGRLDLDVRELDGEPERAKAIVGHLVRAGVVRPSPSPPDRVVGRIAGEYDRAARGLARSSAQEGGKIRWRQYRSIWGFVESDQCRRRMILQHFGDPRPPEPDVPCCDICEPSLIPAAAPVRSALARGKIEHSGELDASIVSVVRSALPSIGRTKVADVLRGSRAKAVLRNSWDGLPEYGAFSHLRADDVLAQIDALLQSGVLVSSGAPYPVLSEGSQEITITDQRTLAL